MWFVLIAIGLYALLFLCIFLVYRKNHGANRKTDPRADAEVYLAFGDKKKAVDILNKYLLENPDDPKAISLLNKANRENCT